MPVNGESYKSSSIPPPPLLCVCWLCENSCSLDGELRLWDAKTGANLRSFHRHEEAVNAFAWLPDGRHFLSGGLDKLLLLWRTDGTVLQAWHGLRVHDLAVTHDGANVVAVCAERKIRVFRLGSFEGSPRLSSAGETSLPIAHPVTSIQLSRDCAHLLVNCAGDSQTIELWGMRDRAPLLKYEGQKQSRFVIRSAFGGHAERYVISGSEDSQVYIWNRHDAMLLQVLPGHSGAVNAVAWSPLHDDVFVSASDDHTIRIWGPVR
ncbi:WD40-repeat-containing domain protein [Pavlovales sp. CCMP2436]|nr:WD40-repeat-containing domain protein [Pavlovales sp. CCMP2436]